MLESNAGRLIRDHAIDRDKIGLIKQKAYRICLRQKNKQGTLMWQFDTYEEGNWGKTSAKELQQEEVHWESSCIDDTPGQ